MQILVWLWPFPHSHVNFSSPWTGRKVCHQNLLCPDILLFCFCEKTNNWCPYKLKLKEEIDGLPWLYFLSYIASCMHPHYGEISLGNCGQGHGCVSGLLCRSFPNISLAIFWENAKLVSKNSVTDRLVQWMGKLLVNLMPPLLACTLLCPS